METVEQGGMEVRAMAGTEAPPIHLHTHRQPGLLLLPSTLLLP